MTRVEREAEEARAEVEGRLAAASATLDERAAALSAAAAQVRPRPRPLLRMTPRCSRLCRAAWAVSCKVRKAANGSTCRISSKTALVSCVIWHSSSYRGIPMICCQVLGVLLIGAP